MSSGSHLQSNIDRFSGFEEDYDRYRPKAPKAVVEMLTRYLDGTPEQVADVGCGTGLSSFVWLGHAGQITGVEPNDDMRGKALEHAAGLPAETPISFVKGYSDKLPFESGSVDLITCSQSFHWMEPVSTLREFARVLRPEGVFAAYDCDWPLPLHGTVEMAYERLIEQAEQIIADRVPVQNHAVKRDKEKHLTQIRASGHFRFSREIVFSNTELCDAERYIGLAISQGGVQTVFRLGGTIQLNEQLTEFRRLTEEYFAGRTLEVTFSYRMRLGIK